MKTELVRFHDTELVCFTNSETPFVAIRPVADSIGLDPDRAVRTVKNHPVLGAKVSVQTGLDAANRRFDMHCLSLTHLPGWLFTINPNKVATNVRPRLLLFQDECFQVLYDHFFGKTRKVINNEHRIFHINRELEEQGRIIGNAKIKVRELMDEKAQLEADNGFQLGLFEAMPTTLVLN